MSTAWFRMRNRAAGSSTEWRWICEGGLPRPRYARWMLELGAVFMRTETELILKSRRVVPARLLENGFVFKCADWNEAARELCAEWRAVCARRGLCALPSAA